MSKNKKEIDWLIVLPQDRLSGGAEQLLMNLTTYLSGQGEKCCVMFLKKKIYGDWEHLEDICDIKYSSFKNIYLGYLSLLPSLIKISKSHKIKRTFTSQTLINAMLGWLKKIGYFPSTVIIVRESNSIFHLLKGLKLKIYALAYRLGYGKVDLVICQTEFMKEQLVHAMPWMEKKLKMIVLPNPINMEIIAQKNKDTLPELNNIKYIVAAGRLVPAKGFDILVQSFVDLNKEFPDLQLLILGEGPERQNLQEMIQSLSLSEKVQLVGFVNNVYPYFKTATACVLSSRIEGFPNVLLQMMSQNNKVVSTLNAGGIEDLNGVFTCETEDRKQLANAIARCLKADTKDNRALFDNDLRSRTVEAFISKTLKNTTKHNG